MFRNFCVDEGFGVYTVNVKTFVQDGKSITRGSGYVGITPHRFRHFQATQLLAKGADLKTVQTRLGHEDPAFTARQYAHRDMENDRKAAELIDSLLG